MTSEKFKDISLNDDDGGRRLDHILKTRFPHLTQAIIQKSLRSKMVRLNGKKSSAEFRPSQRDVLRVPSFFYDAHKMSNHQPSPDKLSTKLPREIVLYEDNDIMMLGKPSGLAVQGGSGTHHHIDKMLESLPKRNNFRPSSVHRLDRDTSGCLLVAKKRHIAAKMGKKFVDREIDKFYVALCYGKSDRNMGVLDMPLIKRKIDNYHDRVEICEHNESGAQIAQTIFCEIDHNAEHNITLMLLKPLTGRTHQLRVHLESVGCPILGDSKYGSETLDLIKKFPLRSNLYLHAYRVQFEHPQIDLNKKMDLRAPLPDHFKNALDYFGLISPKKISGEVYEMFSFSEQSLHKEEDFRKMEA